MHGDVASLPRVLLGTSPCLSSFVFALARFTFTFTSLFSHSSTVHASSRSRRALLASLRPHLFQALDLRALLRSASSSLCVLVLYVCV